MIVPWTEILRERNSTFPMGAKFMGDQNYKEDDVVAEYVSALTDDLAGMALLAGHSFLAFILQMATLEAERICGHMPATPPGDLATALDAHIQRHGSSGRRSHA